MGDVPTSQQLLRQFVETGSQDAFTKLVQAHLDLVYHAARRQVGNEALAQDVTQAVFIILARKAARLTQVTVLEGWLVRTAHFVASEALRENARRKAREQKAAAMRSEQSTQISHDQLEAHLDEALSHLPTNDRDAVVLRYLCPAPQRSYETVATTLGVTEEAAKKRVSRALSKLRRILERRDIALSAALLATSLSALTTHAAPPALAAPSVAAVAVSASAPVTTSILLAKGAMKTMVWLHLKSLAVIFAASIAVVLGAGAVLQQTLAQPPQPPETSAPIAAQAPTTEPAPAFNVSFANGLSIELLGLSTAPPGNDTWFSADGSPRDPVQFPPDQAPGNLGVPNPNRVFQAAVRLRSTDPALILTDIHTHLSGGNAGSSVINMIGKDLRWLVFSMSPDATMTSISVDMAVGPWTNYVVALQEKESPVLGLDAVEATMLQKQPNQTILRIREHLSGNIEREFQLKSRTANAWVKGLNTMTQSGFTETTSTVTFPVAADDIVDVRLRARIFTHTAKFSGIALARGQDTSVLAEPETRQDLPVREAANDFVRTLGKQPLPLAPGSPNADNLETLGRSLDASTATLQELWVNRDSACALVEGVRQAGTPIRLGILLTRTGDRWFLQNLQLLPTERDAAEFLDRIKRSSPLP